MRTVLKFCSVVIEEIQLIVTDESPDWKYDDEVRVPGKGASVNR